MLRLGAKLRAPAFPHSLTPGSGGRLPHRGQRPCSTRAARRRRARCAAVGRAGMTGDPAQRARGAMDAPLPKHRRPPPRSARAGGDADFARSQAPNLHPGLLQIERRADDDLVRSDRMPPTAPESTPAALAVRPAELPPARPPQSEPRPLPAVDKSACLARLEGGRCGKPIYPQLRRGTHPTANLDATASPYPGDEFTK